MIDITLNVNVILWTIIICSMIGAICRIINGIMKNEKTTHYGSDEIITGICIIIIWIIILCI